MARPYYNSRGKLAVEFYDELGKRCRLVVPGGPFKSKAEERQAGKHFQRKILEKAGRESSIAQAMRIIFSDVTYSFLDSKVGISEKTVADYRSICETYLIPYFGNLKIAEIRLADVERFRNEMATGYPPVIVNALAKRKAVQKHSFSRARAKRRIGLKKPSISLINKCLLVASMIWTYAEKNEWVDRNPVRYVERLKAPIGTDRVDLDEKVLSPDEARLLIDAARPAQRDRNGALISNNYQLIVETTLFTGMRSAELRGLQWGDINWLTAEIFVRRSWKNGAFRPPKTKSSVRRIPLPDFLLSKLKLWKAACPIGEFDLVFPNLSGKPISRANLLNRGFYPALRRAGIRKIRFHDLRHTYASLLIANGEDIVRVSRMLGHASPTITLNVYAHMLPKDHYGSADRLADLVFGSKDDSQKRADRG
jgi:integrase